MAPTVHFWIPADRSDCLSGGISGKGPKITTPIPSTEIRTVADGRFSCRDNRRGPFAAELWKEATEQAQTGRLDEHRQLNSPDIAPTTPDNGGVSPLDARYISRARFAHATIYAVLVRTAVW